MAARQQALRLAAHALEQRSTRYQRSCDGRWGYVFWSRAARLPIGSKASAADWRGVTVDYFRTLGVPLLHGRKFTQADVKNQNSIVINEAMARRFWPGTDPIGQRILIGHRSDPLEIIGVVGDVKGARLDAKAKRRCTRFFTSSGMRFW
jgi:MacB-like periplasmic core domain